MTDPNESDTYSEAETDARRESILKRVLATPPRPKKAKSKRSEVKDSHDRYSND